MEPDYKRFMVFTNDPEALKAYGTVLPNHYKSWILFETKLAVHEIEKINGVRRTVLMY